MRIKNFAISLLAVLALGGSAVAQNRTGFGGLYNAFDFAYGVQPNVPALTVTQGQNTSGTYSIALSSGTITLGDGTIVAPLAIGIPIVVGIGASQETVTPTGVSAACSTPNAPQNACLVTAVFTQAHNTGDLVASASNGLQEAALYATGKGGGLVVLSPAWFKQYASIAAGRTAIATFNSLGSTYHVLDYSGNSTGSTTTAAHSWFNATAGSAYAATTIVLY